MFLFLIVARVLRWFTPEEAPKQFLVEVDALPEQAPFKFGGDQVRVWVFPAGSEPLSTDGDELYYAGPDGVGSCSPLPGVKSVEFGPLED